MLSTRNPLYSEREQDIGNKPRFWNNASSRAECFGAPNTKAPETHLSLCSGRVHDVISNTKVFLRMSLILFHCVYCTNCRRLMSRFCYASIFAFSPTHSSVRRCLTIPSLARSSIGRLPSQSTRHSSAFLTASVNWLTDLLDTVSLLAAFKYAYAIFRTF